MLSKTALANSAAKDGHLICSPFFYSGGSDWSHGKKFVDLRRSSQMASPQVKIKSEDGQFRRSVRQTARARPLIELHHERGLGADAAHDVACRLVTEQIC